MLEEDAAAKSQSWAHLREPKREKLSEAGT
jgi:hypothetical protein